MPANKLKSFLDANKVSYVVINHSSAYTAQDVAATAHVSGKDLAKTVMVKIDNKLAMAVVPASYNVNFNKLKTISGAKKVELANEGEFESMFPECEPGAMPPFGNLYNMSVYVSNTLAEDEEIAFNAGTHNELIKMSYKDFERLVQPRVEKFSEKIL